MRKLLLFIFFVIMAPVLYNLDAIYGAWKFSRLCKNEGGPRFYSKVDRNIGWLVIDINQKDSSLSYQRPFRFHDIAFVRWRRNNGVEFDVYVNSPPVGAEYSGGYWFSPIDKSKIVKYEYRYVSAVMHDDRYGKTVHKIIDIENGQVAAEYTIFSFQWAKPERVILNAPTVTSCWDGQTRREQEIYYNFFKNIFNGKAE